MRSACQYLRVYTYSAKIRIVAKNKAQRDSGDGPTGRGREEQKPLASSFCLSLSSFRSLHPLPGSLPLTRMFGPAH